MKKLNKLGVKKITLRNLDQPALDGIGGALSVTCPIHTCATCVTCAVCHGVRKEPREDQF